VLLVLLSAFGLGIAFCAPPGAVTAEAIRRGLTGGFRPAFFLEVGSLVGDATWAGIALAGAAVLVQNPMARIAVGIVGALLLFRLGWSAIQDALHYHELKLAPLLGRGHFVTGAMLSLTNPLNVAFWVGVGGGAVQSIVPHPTPLDYGTFYLGFMLACTGWCFAFSGVVAFGRTLLRPSFFRIVNAVCGVALVLFGLQLLRGVFLAA
jgi:threonine/homoserine/homoserine lactone efflux protein